MVNVKLGFYSSILAATSTAIFALSMLFNNNLLSFGVCIILSWAYVTLTCAFAYQSNQEKKSLGYTGMMFAGIYSTFITLVYFTQLTTVNQNAASIEILKILRFEPGSWLFAFNLLGYGMMALSTFFIGLSITTKTKVDKWLKALLIAHCTFAPVCVVFPMMNLFNTIEDVQNVSNMGMLGLEGWCLYFLPTMILAAIYFKRKI